MGGSHWEVGGGGAVEFLNPQILEVGGTKKKNPPSYAFPEEGSLL